MLCSPVLPPGGEFLPPRHADCGLGRPLSLAFCVWNLWQVQGNYNRFWYLSQNTVTKIVWSPYLNSKDKENLNHRVTECNLYP